MFPDEDVPIPFTKRLNDSLKIKKKKKSTEERSSMDQEKTEDK